MCVSSFFGAGDRTRTGTLSPAVDFEGYIDSVFRSNLHSTVPRKR